MDITELIYFFMQSEIAIQTGSDNLIDIWHAIVRDNGRFDFTSPCCHGPVEKDITNISHHRVAMVQWRRISQIFSAHRKKLSMANGFRSKTAYLGHANTKQNGNCNFVLNCCDSATDAEKL